MFRPKRIGTLSLATKAVTYVLVVVVGAVRHDAVGDNVVGDVVIVVVNLVAKRRERKRDMDKNIRNYF